MRLKYFILSLFISATAFAQSPKSFKVVPLGVLGGVDESNMSAYMIAPTGSNNFICMDAGTLHYGIEQAIKNKVFNIPADEVLKKYIKDYFISHSHLDHVSGLIINSPDDSTKNIYAFADCINTLKTHYFTWTSWANFANEGEAPALKKYTYQVMTPGVEVNAANTEMAKLITGKKFKEAFCSSFYSFFTSIGRNERVVVGRIDK